MSIAKGRHYVIAADELATWVDRQGDRWWEVDGDPILTGTVSFPCPGDELSAVLRRLRSDLYVRARPDDNSAKGSRITFDKLDSVVGRLGDDVQIGMAQGESPSWLNDRVLWMSWTHTPTVDWMLCEDEQIRQAAIVDEATASASEE